MTVIEPVAGEIRALVAPHRHTPGPLLVVLHAVQNALGYIPPAAVPVIADELNLSRAEVHGVISFYHHFRRRPALRHVLQICMAESCQATGANELVERARMQLATAAATAATTAAATSAGVAAVELQPVYCLGLCACSPALMIDGEVYGRVTPERLDQLLAACASRP